MQSIRNMVHRRIPAKYLPHAQAIWWHLRAIRYLRFGRPAYSGETAKARRRREKEGFFPKYCKGRGLDIGYGGDLLCNNCDGFDFEDGDAQCLPNVPDESYDFINASHVLEHLIDPELALRRWSRVLKPGGYMIILVPHRDLYEKRTRLPSRWNPDHKRFFLLDEDDPPDTIGLVPLLQRTLPGHVIVHVKVCDEGHTIDAPDIHSDGEFSIEAVTRKEK